MSEYELILLQDPKEAAAKLIDLNDRIEELEATVKRLVRINKLRDVGVE